MEQSKECTKCNGYKKVPMFSTRDSQFIGFKVCDRCKGTGEEPIQNDIKNN